MKLKILKVGKVPLWKIWYIISRDEITYSVDGKIKKCILYDATFDAYFLLHYTRVKALGYWSQFKLPVNSDHHEIFTQYSEKFGTPVPKISQIIGVEFDLPDEVL
jgi:hypothetical protein